MNDVIVQISNLCKIYRDKDKQVKALDGVNISIMRGEILALLGVNGAGKTTLSSILATLHPPTSGDVLYNGISIYKNILDYRRFLGFCPQYANLDTYLTVEENLYFAGRYFLLEKQHLKHRVEKLMGDFDLYKYAHFNVNHLSGGWKQRLLIARALIHEPKIVLLDEPTVGLDPDIRRILWNYIKMLRHAGITVILTTHYLDEAEELADRVCILDKGNVLLTEPMATLKAQHGQATLEDIFIGIVGKHEE